MRQNAFGDLRFSGRDPVEVIDELRASWAEGGPILDAEDRAQAERFDAIVARVLDASAAPPRDDSDGGGRRRRRDRHAAQPPPASIEQVPDAAASATAEIAEPDAFPTATHDAVTRPAHLPPEPPIPLQSPAVLIAPGAAAPVRAKSISSGPPIDDIDTAWDLGDEDPTAKPDLGSQTSPSATEMAGDGVVEGDGLDTGWD